MSAFEVAARLIVGGGLIGLAAWLAAVYVRTEVRLWQEYRSR